MPSCEIDTAVVESHLIVTLGVEHRITDFWWHAEVWVLCRRKVLVVLGAILNGS